MAPSIHIATGRYRGGVITAAASALAAVVPMDVPIGWGGDQDRDVNMVHALLILGGIPLLLFLAITVAVYIPSLVRGERIAPGQAPVENQWLGGPRTGTAELKGPESEDVDAGGASGRW
jgi:hypothetical protein